MHIALSFDYRRNETNHLMLLLRFLHHDRLYLSLNYSWNRRFFCELFLIISLMTINTVCNEVSMKTPMDKDLEFLGSGTFTAFWVMICPKRTWEIYSYSPKPWPMHLFLSLTFVISIITKGFLCVLWIIWGNLSNPRRILWES